jgi:hypothetical protein
MQRMDGTRIMTTHTTDPPVSLGTATVMIHAFEAGQRIDQIARRHEFTREFVEQLIRRTLLARRTGTRQDPQTALRLLAQLVEKVALWPEGNNPEFLPMMKAARALLTRHTEGRP